MNVIAQLAFELAYYDSAVQRFNHYTTRRLPKIKKMQIMIMDFGQILDMDLEQIMKRDFGQIMVFGQIVLHQNQSVYLHFPLHVWQWLYIQIFWYTDNSSLEE